MFINVTQEDITKAKELPLGTFAFPRCRNCPVARALNRATGLEWMVGISGAESDNGSYAALPPFVGKFIRDFDSGIEVTPFEFEIKF